MVVELPLEGRTLSVSKIVCMARNYEAHAAELQQTLPATPVYFLKPASCLLVGGGEVRMPMDIGRVDVETELAVVIGREAKEVPAGRAMDFISGYAVFFDITARDVQALAARAGNPWTVSKGYDTFGPISVPVPAAGVGDPHALLLRLRVNGVVRQDASTALMRFRVAEQIAAVSRVMTLEAGDIIATGTPAGVWPIQPGDVLEAEIQNVGRLRCTVVARKR